MLERPNVARHLPLRGGVLDRHEDRIVAAMVPEDLGPGQAVERDGHPVGFARRGVQHDQGVAGGLDGQHPFGDPLLVGIGHARRRRMGRR